MCHIMHRFIQRMTSWASQCYDAAVAGCRAGLDAPALDGADVVAYFAEEHPPKVTRETPKFSIPGSANAWGSTNKSVSTLILGEKNQQTHNFDLGHYRRLPCGDGRDTGRSSTHRRRRGRVGGAGGAGEQQHGY